MQERMFKVWLNVVFAMVGVGCLALLGISFLHLIQEPLQTYFAYAIAICFWGSLSVECFATWKCRQYRKQLRTSRRKEKKSWRTAGILSFGKNREGVIADFGMIGSALLVVVLVVLEININWLVVGSVLLLFLTIQLHCLLNGKNYRYMKLLNRKREKKK